MLYFAPLVNHFVEITLCTLHFFLAFCSILPNFGLWFVNFVKRAVAAMGDLVSTLVLKRLESEPLPQTIGQLASEIGRSRQAVADALTKLREEDQLLPGCCARLASPIEHQPSAFMHITVDDMTTRQLVQNLIVNSPITHHLFIVSGNPTFCVSLASEVNNRHLIELIEQLHMNGAKTETFMVLDVVKGAPK